MIERPQGVSSILPPDFFKKHNTLALKVLNIGDGTGVRENGEEANFIKSMISIGSFALVVFSGAIFLSSPPPKERMKHYIFCSGLLTTAAACYVKAAKVYIGKMLTQGQEVAYEGGRVSLRAKYQNYNKSIIKSEDIPTVLKLYSESQWPEFIALMSCEQLMALTTSQEGEKVKKLIAQVPSQSIEIAKARYILGLHTSSSCSKTIDYALQQDPIFNALSRKINNKETPPVTYNFLPAYSSDSDLKLVFRNGSFENANINFLSHHFEFFKRYNDNWKKNKDPMVIDCDIEIFYLLLIISFEYPLHRLTPGEIAQGLEAADFFGHIKALDFLQEYALAHQLFNTDELEELLSPQNNREILRKYFRKYILPSTLTLKNILQSYLRATKVGLDIEARRCQAYIRNFFIDSLSNDNMHNIIESYKLCQNILKGELLGQLYSEFLPSILDALKWKNLCILAETYTELQTVCQEYGIKNQMSLRQDCPWKGIGEIPAHVANIFFN